MNECNELLQQCARGNHQAFKRLYELTSPRLYALCLRFLKKRELAEEILQEAFVKIWDNAWRYIPEKGAATTWMTTVVRNKALDKLRSLKNRPKEVDVVWESMEFASTELQPREILGLSQEAKQLHHCLNKLKTIQQECILLSFYEGYTHEELSQKLERPLGTIKAWIRRGLERIRKCMG